MPTLQPHARITAPDAAGRSAADHTRVWPAILALFVLAPVTAEVLSGSTPILAFVTHPIVSCLNFPLYGCGALLVREVARRRSLGWASVLWMGAAYGVFEEGVVLNTWADPWAHPVCTVTRGVMSGLCDYSRVGGINLLWALGLTAYHAVISMTIPILLVELAFPRCAMLPWLDHKAVRACVASELVVLALGLALNFADFRQHGQAGPLLGPYLIEIALMAGCIALALLLRPRAGSHSTRGAPKLWLLRLLGFLGVVLLIVTPSIDKGSHVPYRIALALNATIVALAIWRLTSWSRRAGWSERQMLALASGALGFFIFFWDPLLELSGQAGGNPTRGTALVGLAYLIGLIVLAGRTQRRWRQQSA